MYVSVEVIRLPDSSVRTEVMLISTLFTAVLFYLVELVLYVHSQQLRACPDILHCSWASLPEAKLQISSTLIANEENGFGM